jgi:hypothetical protein
LVEHPVPGLLFDAWVDDGDDLEPLLVESPQHPVDVGEGLLVPGEDAVAVHVLDVQPQAVARDLATAVLRRDLLDGVLRVAKPAALVVAEGPQRWGCDASGEPRVCRQDRGHVGSREDVLRVLAAVELDPVLRRVREVVVPAVAVVDERRGHLPGGVALVVEERDRHVVRVELGAGAVRAGIRLRSPGGELTGRVWVENVNVPQREVPTPPILVPRLLAETVDRVLGRAPPTQGERIVKGRVAPEVTVVVGGLDHR